MLWRSATPAALLTLLLAGCAPPLPGVRIEGISSPARPGSAEPRLGAGADGTLILSWVEPFEGGHRLMYAPVTEEGFGEPREVARGADWFVNWADFPSVQPLAADLWAAHWLVKREGGPYAYDVAVALSTDAGVTWQPAVTPHGDGTPTEHGFVSLFPLGGGAGVAWLDGRESGGAHGTMRLQTAVIARDGEISGEHVLDGRVCDCCQTNAALAARGPVVVYRGRTADEVRDIQIVRWDNGSWSEPALVAADGWTIGGCPVNGPAVDAQGEDVVVAWFTAADDKPRVRLARSTDGGRTFGAPVDVSTSGAVGRAAVVLDAKGDAFASWMEGASLSNVELRVRRLPRDDVPGSVHSVARTGASREVGFPQLAFAGERLVVAWTEPGPPTQVRVARITAP